MSVLAIEINDTGIEAVSDSDPGTEAISPSPGVVVLDGETLLTGREAASRARLKPRWTYDRFWEELDEAPLPRPFPRTLRRADLAHAHLEEIWESTRERADDVVLAIPGCFSHEQLGLVLGIARACGMPVTGMIDSSVASSTLPGLFGLSGQGSNPTPVAVHLDLHLHRTVATRVDRDHQVRGEVKRGRIEVNDDVGLVTLFDAWVRLIAQIFVRTTRFDPLHRGESEQALYLRLPGWLDELRREDKATLVMEAGGKDHSIEITREQIVACAQPVYDQVGQLAKALEPAGQQTTLLVSKRMAELPGLEDFLRLANENLVALPGAAGAKGALKLVGRFRSDTPKEELPFVTRIALSDAIPEGPEAPEAEDGRPAPIVSELAEGSPAPTHVLYEGLAHPITSKPFVIGLSVPEGSHGIDLAERSGSTAGISRSHCSIYRIGDRVLVEDHSSYGSFLNDKRIETKAILAAGDCLRVGTPGAELRLIAVMDSDGTPQD